MNYGVIAIKIVNVNNILSFELTSSVIRKKMCNLIYFDRYNDQLLISCK